ncbi:MAG: MFS transporter [Candidatus Helarchaeota archaeon]
MSSQREIYKSIKKNRLVWKFSFYGFLKNLKFFEPYLLLILLYLGYNLFEAGLLVMIIEITTYLLEVPSGILSDKFGKKKVLQICFILYCISFVFYFFGFDPLNTNFLILIGASFFFGLGEAFRSGTHKAMILTWAKKEGYSEYITFVYGRTRSFALVGEALSGILSVIFILIIQVPPDRTIFLLTIIPYILDFILISTYPKYMNEHEKYEKGKLNEFFKGVKQLKVVFSDKKLNRALLSSTLYDAIFKVLKDYIQPIMKLYFGMVIVMFLINPTTEQIDFYVSITLGLLYTLFYFISSFASKNSYRINRKLKNSKRSMDILFDLFGITLFLTAILIWTNLIIIIIIIYLIIYVIFNIRRPIVIDYLGSIIESNQQATILSVESLIKSVFTFIFAPLFGFIADNATIPILFIGISIFIVVINRFLSRKIKEIKNSD